ncbi:MAG: CapA family protein [Faecousia sp.]
MASEYDDLIKKRREARQKQREAELARRKLMLRLAIALVVVAAVAAVILTVALRARKTPGNPAGTDPSTTVGTVPPTESAPAATKPPVDQNTTVIHIAAAGDLNVTDTIIEANRLEDGSYDFTDAFTDVMPILSGADIAVVNLEGNISGAPYGSQTSSAPQALASALAAAGVDLVQTANSACIRNGILGLQATLTNLRSAGLEPLGTYADAADFRERKGYTIVEAQGIRVAFVAFTKGMDNLGLPEGSEKCVNLLYNDYSTTYQSVNTSGITDILKKVRSEDPDLIVAMLHWGSEYNDEISYTQKTIRNLLFDQGVDAIIGTHPHYVQGISFDEEKGQLVAYSLGDFYGDATQAGTNYAIMLDLEVTQDRITGATKITGYEYIPIYTVKPEESLAGGQRVLRIETAMQLFEGNFIGKINQETYDKMISALSRIEDRVVPKT